MAAKKKAPKEVVVDAPDDAAERGGARTFWSGTISFGLVSVPVEMYAAQRTTRTSLRTLAPDGTPLSRRYFRAGKEQELDNTGLERGYELDDGSVIPLSAEELESLLPEKSRDIDLRTFVDASQIDPRYLDRAYFLLPSGGNTLAYRLLATAMERAGKVGVATFVMRAKEYVVAIEAEEGLLRAQTLRFSDELRTPEDLGLPAPTKVDADMVREIKKHVTGLKKREIALSELDDPYWERLEALVEKKRKKHEGVVAPAVVDEEESAGAEVIDLLSVLRESLKKNGSAKGEGPSRPKNTRPGTRKRARKAS
jgi:DNA end-binding protein Ku